MKELFSGIYEWSWFSDEKGYDFNGHLIVSGGERVMIDPPPMTPEEEDQLKKMGPVSAILITNVHHVREAEKYRHFFSAKVYAPQKDASGMDIKPDITFNDGDRLPGGLEAVGVPDNKSAGETALYLRNREGGIWFLGDALIGVPVGSLSLMSADKYKDGTKAKDGVRVLLSRPFEAILVGDGCDVLKQGKSVLERFLAKGI